MKRHYNRKAKDTDYLLITEDMKTYGCGCCSIGLGRFFSSLDEQLGSNWVTCGLLDSPSLSLGAFKGWGSLWQGYHWGLRWERRMGGK